VVGEEEEEMEEIGDIIKGGWFILFSLSISLEDGNERLRGKGM